MSWKGQRQLGQGASYHSIGLSLLSIIDNRWDLFWTFIRIRCTNTSRSWWTFPSKCELCRRREKQNAYGSIDHQGSPLGSWVVPKKENLVKILEKLLSRWLGAKEIWRSLERSKRRKTCHKLGSPFQSCWSTQKRCLSTRTLNREGNAKNMEHHSSQVLLQLNM